MLILHLLSHFGRPCGGFRVYNSLILYTVRVFNNFYIASPFSQSVYGKTYHHPFSQKNNELQQLFFFGICNHTCWWFRNPARLHQLVVLVVYLVIYHYFTMGFIHPMWLHRRISDHGFHGFPRNTPWRKISDFALLLLMEEILHQLIGSLSHYLQGFIHPRWCVAINLVAAF